MWSYFSIYGTCRFALCEQETKAISLLVWTNVFQSVFSLCYYEVSASFLWHHAAYVRSFYVANVYLYFCVRPPRCHHLYPLGTLVYRLGESWAGVWRRWKPQVSEHHLDVVQSSHSLSAFQAIMKCSFTLSVLLNCSLHGAGIKTQISHREHAYTHRL